VGAQQGDEADEAGRKRRSVASYPRYWADLIEGNAAGYGRHGMGDGISLAGIPVPSREPWFLATVGVHVLAGILAVIAGATAMLSPKAPGRHPHAGTVYFWALVTACVTMSALALARWPVDNHLFALGVLALGSATIGRAARRRLWGRWVRVHISLMGLSYVLMLTAFYVDNGPHLPLWNRLPPLAFWLLPTLVGVPLIVRALRRPPLLQQ
jgi:hypothetical protein